MCRQDHHTDPAVANGTDRHLLAHQEGVVHAGGVAHAHLEGDVAAMQVKIGRPGDVGEPALLAAVLGLGIAQEIVAKADVTLQQIAVEIAVFVFLTQQQLELLAQTLAGFFPHRFDLLADLFHLSARIGALGQLTQTPALAEQAVPLVLFHQLEPRPNLSAVRPGHQMQRRHDRGPRVHVRRQQVRPAGKGIDQRRLAGFHLTEDGNGRLERIQVVLQFGKRLRRRFTGDPAQG